MGCQRLHGLQKAVDGACKSRLAHLQVATMDRRARWPVAREPAVNPRGGWASLLRALEGRARHAPAQAAAVERLRGIKA